MADIDPRKPYEVAMPKPGEEISSTGEGRHVLVEESRLIYPVHTDGLVHKGDPVAFWDGAGVALKTATSTADHIPVDTEGIWRLEVVSYNGIMVGQVLAIDASGEINDLMPFGFTIFGYALQSIRAPQGEEFSVPAIIAVKVHWMVPWWYYWGDFFEPDWET